MSASTDKISDFYRQLLEAINEIFSLERCLKNTPDRAARALEFDSLVTIKILIRFSITRFSNLTRMKRRSSKILNSTLYANIIYCPSSANVT